MPNDNSSTTTNNGATKSPASSLPTVQDPVSDSIPSQDTRPIPADVQEPSSAPSDAKSLDSSEPSKSSESNPVIYSEVVRRISEAKNVLIALSSNPSVDEMAAAIGLSIFLDKLGKRATAIYSGTTPNALEFLKPEDTFEPTADTLQDFVIAISKEKADHLRYKLDGSYVKIYITPYRSRIGEEDLEFSYGDYNVDLVLALDVANGIDLDSALREHGRIMHDASIVNITTGRPGKFGEIEWSDKSASSISEMIARLLYHVESDVKIGKEEATAFLTGIVAATNRFSNANTTPETMKVSSLLMESGANQQLVSRNITSDVENEIISLDNSDNIKTGNGSSGLDVAHKDNLLNSEATVEQDSQSEADASSTKEDNAILDDLKAAEESLSLTGTETTPETAEEPFEINSSDTEAPAKAEAELSSPSTAQEEDVSASPLIEANETTPGDSQRVTLEPSTSLSSDFSTPTKDKDYSQMLEDSIIRDPSLEQSREAKLVASSIKQPLLNPITANVPNVPTSPEINGVPEISYMPTPGEDILPPPPAPPIDGIDPTSQFSSPASPSEPLVRPAEVVSPISLPNDSINSATPSAETVSSAAVPDEPSSITNSILPPVEIPSPVAISSEVPNPISSPAEAASLAAPAAPATPLETPSVVAPSPEISPTPSSLGSQPAMQDQVYVPQASDPSAFKIPGT